MSRIRIAVTGLGVVSALGPDLACFRDGLRAGRSGLGPLTLFDGDGLRGRIVGQAVDPGAADAAVPTSRGDRFGVAAARAAVAHAGLDGCALAGAGVVFGVGSGGAALVEQYLRSVDAHDEAGELPSLAWMRAQQPASVSDLVARAFAAGGPRQTVMTGCSSSALAIGMAADWLRLGEVDVALAGGVEGLCRLTSAGFSSIRAVSPRPCRPFDAERDGLNLGEGGAVLVLESWEHAVARGATIWAELAGWGAAGDAWHATAPRPDGEGAARAMRAALADAALPPTAIDHVNAHGTATAYNDAAEARAIAAVFGAHTPKVAVSSVKSMIGHTLGAAGAIEAAASVLSLRDGFVPPTLHTERLDPSLAVDVVLGAARRRPLGAVLSNSFAFGGNNVALVFARPDA